MDQYTIKTDHFEGPFDLLLFFIERDELDIYDIPIAKITSDFLDYIRHLELLNIDVASEFILMAATLMKIKSRMLIPRKELDEQGNEIDPRQELARKLLEYKKFKSVIDDFSELEENRQKKFNRGGTILELRQIAEKALIDSELESLSLYKLMQTFRQLLEKYERDKKKAVHRIVRFDYTVEEQQNYLLKLLPFGQKLRFEGIFHALENRIHAIVTFMALLDLLNMQKVKIIQGEGANNFWVEKIAENT